MWISIVRVLRVLYALCILLAARHHIAWNLVTSLYSRTSYVLEVGGIGAE